MMEARHDNDLCVCGVVNDGVRKLAEHQVAILRFESSESGWRSADSVDDHIHGTRKFKSQPLRAIFVPALRRKNLSLGFWPEN